MNRKVPSWDEWMDEARRSRNSERIGMYLCHTGVVRGDSRAAVRDGVRDDKPVTGMILSYDESRLQQALEETEMMDGIFYVRAWINAGELKVGDDIMHVIVGGDIRPHVADALECLVDKIKTDCLTENEIQ